MIRRIVRLCWMNGGERWAWDRNIRDRKRLSRLTHRAEEAVRRSRSESMHVIEHDLGIRREGHDPRATQIDHLEDILLEMDQVHERLRKDLSIMRQRASARQQEDA